MVRLNECEWCFSITVSLPVTSAVYHFYSLAQKNYLVFTSITSESVSFQTLCAQQLKAYIGENSIFFECEYTLFSINNADYFSSFT